MPEFKSGDVVRFKAQPEYRFSVNETKADGLISCQRLYARADGVLEFDATEFAPLDIELVPKSVPFGECGDGPPMCRPGSCSIEQTVEKATIEGLLEQAADMLEYEGFDRLAGQVDFVRFTYESADETVKE